MRVYRVSFRLVVLKTYKNQKLTWGCKKKLTKFQTLLRFLETAMGSSYCPHDITQCTLTNQSINLLIILRNVDQLDMLAGTICMLTIPWYIKRTTWISQLNLLLPVTVLLYCRWTLPLLSGTKNLNSRRRPRVMRRWHQQKWWVLPSLLHLHLFFTHFLFS